MRENQQNRRENNRSEPRRATLWIGVMILVALFSVGFASAITWDNVGYYKLDGTTGAVVDATENGNDGTNTGATRGVEGKIGNAFSFDGDNDGVEMGDLGSFGSNLGDGVSVSFWVKTTEAGKRNTIGADSVGSEHFLVMFNWADGGTEDTGKLKMQIRDESAVISNAYTTNDVNFRDGEWHHIVMTYNASADDIKIYLDGSSQTLSTSLNAPSDFSRDFSTSFIGAIGGDYTAGIFDEVGFFNRPISQDDVDDLYNSGDGLSYGGPEINVNLISPEDNAILSDVGTNFTANYSIVVSSNWTNATYYVWNSTGIFNNSVVVEITGTENSTTEYIDALTLGDYEWNVYTCYGNTTFSNCTFAYSNYSFFVGASIDAEEYNNITYETSAETFIINISLISGTEFYDAQMDYNGTLYKGTITDLGDDKYSIKATLDIPAVSSGTNMSFYWVLYYDAFGSITQNLPARTQTVLPISDIEITTGACSAGFFESVNYTFADEKNFTDLRVDLKYNFKFGIGELTSNVVNGSFTNTSSFAICINQTMDSYKLGYGEIQYETSGYVSRRYYMFEYQSLSNSTTSSHVLYDLVNGDATSFLFEIKNTFLNPFIDKYVGLMRWYPEEDEYKVVEMARTDEDGKTIMKVKTEDVDYRVAIYELNGELIKLAEPVRMACLVEPCTYTLVIIQEEQEYFDVYDIENSLIFDSDNNRFVFIWNDPTQLTGSMRLLVYKETGLQEIVICNSTASGYTGVLTCDVGDYGGLLTAKAFRTSSPETIFASLSKTIRTAWNNTMGLFIAFILVLIGGFVAIWSPIAAVIMVVVSLIPSVIFGSITFTIFMAVVVLGGSIIHMIKRTK